MSISTDFKQIMDVGEQKRKIANRIKSRYSYGKIYAEHDTIMKGTKRQEVLAVKRNMAKRISRIQ